MPVKDLLPPVISIATKLKLVSEYKDVPPYMDRKGFVPRKIEDYGDGGAFPDIHTLQFPLDMGRCQFSKPSSATLPLSLDANGNVAYDPIVKQNENANKIVYTQRKDLVPKLLGDSRNRDDEDDLQEKIKTTQETEAEIGRIVNEKLSAAQGRNTLNSRYVKYKPSQNSAVFNSGAKERVIRISELPVDPLVLPKFKNKEVPRPSGSPPVPVLHSPPRPLTVEDYQDWKIPPCISNWKNPKGYTIPLDKRVAADGGDLQDFLISDKLAKFAEAMYIAEAKSREKTQLREKVARELKMKQKEIKEQKLSALAREARFQKNAVTAPSAPSLIPSDKTIAEEKESGMQRQKIREERHIEREKGRRLETKENASTAKKKKISRERDRDICENIALGVTNVGPACRGEIIYDQRLFNQEKGMSSGFAADDQYNVYDKGLFQPQCTLRTLCHPKRDVDSDMHGVANQQLKKIMKTERFKPDRGFAGTAAVSAVKTTGSQKRPLEFEVEAKEEDPFGLDKFLKEVKKGRNALDKDGSEGVMKARA